MEISGYVKGRTEKRVTFKNVLVGTGEMALVKAALDHAGETHSSIFGYRLIRPETGKVTVILDTD